MIAYRHGHQTHSMNGTSYILIFQMEVDQINHGVLLEFVTKKRLQVFQMSRIRSWAPHFFQMWMENSLQRRKFNTNIESKKFHTKEATQMLVHERFIRNLKNSANPPTINKPKSVVRLRFFWYYILNASQQNWEQQRNYKGITFERDIISPSIQVKYSMLWSGVKIGITLDWPVLDYCAGNINIFAHTCEMWLQIMCEIQSIVMVLIM